jgi:hypothetical protein
MEKVDLTKCSEDGRAWAKSIGAHDLREWQIEIKRHWCAKCDKGGKRCPDCLIQIASALNRCGHKEQAQRLAELDCGRAWVDAVLAATNEHNQ